MTTVDDAPHQPEHSQPEHSGILRACWGGGLAVVFALFVSGCLTALFAFGGTARDTTHWISVLSEAVTLVRSNTLRPEHFELIFIVSMLGSIFAQGTVQAYFENNEFYENTRLRIPSWLRKRRGKSNRPVSESVWVGVVMVILAAVSITFVNTDSFYMHVFTTLAYLLIVAGIDLVYWLMIGPESQPRYYRDGQIPADKLFKEFNRQLVLRIDFGVIMVAVIPSIRWWYGQGFAAQPSIEEIAFFSGVASFDLVATFFLIFGLLTDFDRILTKKHVIDC